MTFMRNVDNPDLRELVKQSADVLRSYESARRMRREAKVPP